MKYITNHLAPFHPTQDTFAYLSLRNVVFLQAHW